MASILVGACLALYNYFRGYCTIETISESISPDGAWKAVVEDWLCESPVVTNVTAGVRLISNRRDDWATYILGVDSSWHDDKRLKIVWSAADMLQIAVPNLSFLKVSAREFHGVKVDLRFNPDDPAARAAWLRKNDARPDSDLEREW